MNFLYAPSGQLTGLVFDPNLLSWNLVSVNGLTLVRLDGVLLMALIGNTPQRRFARHFSLDAGGDNR